MNSAFPLFIQEILDSLLKTERVKEAKKKIVENEEAPVVYTEVKVIKTEPAPLTAKQLQEQEEAREIMEVSMIDDDLLMDDEVVPPKVVPKITEVKSQIPESNKTQSNGTKIKSISTKSANINATIFDELKDIDFSAEMFDEAIGNVDFNTVSILSKF